MEVPTAQQSEAEVQLTSSTLLRMSPETFAEPTIDQPLVVDWDNNTFLGAV
jgi:hypothetical protein